MLPALLTVLLGAALTLSAPNIHADFYVQDDDHYSVQWESGPAPFSPEVLRAGGPPSHHHPDFPAKHPKETPPSGTIYTVLSEKPHFSRLFKVINISDEVVSLLNDSSVNLTFFAVPNSAIPKRPPHRKHTYDLTHAFHQQSLTDLIFAVESATDENTRLSEQLSDEHFKKLVTAILSYHVIPHDLDLHALVKNTTYPTHLSRVFGALNNEPIRLHFTGGFPFASVNYYAQVIRPDIGATNGFIHAINHPLFPPLSVFQTIFLVHQEFSTLSSAIQRTNLTNLLDYKFVPESIDGQWSTEGSPVVTAFTPSNKAFSRLPRKLQFFLFSPLGERILKKLLQFHIVPDIALYTDWVLNATSDAISEQVEIVTDCDGEGLYNWPEDILQLQEKEVSNFTLPTALDGHSLNLLIVKIPVKLPFPEHGKEFGFIKRVFVNGHPVFGYDSVALNGAFHVVDKLLSPRRPKYGPGLSYGGDLCIDQSDFDAEEYNNDWKGWEEWLLQWAEEN